MKKLLIIAGLLISLSSFSQSKLDSIAANFEQIDLFEIKCHEPELLVVESPELIITYEIICNSILHITENKFTGEINKKIYEIKKRNRK